MMHVRTDGLGVGWLVEGYVGRGTNEGHMSARIPTPSAFNYAGRQLASQQVSQSDNQSVSQSVSQAVSQLVSQSFS